MAGVGLFLVTVVVVLGQGTSITTEPRSTLDWQRTSGTDYWRYLTSRAAGTYPWRYQTSAMPPSTLDWQRTSGTDYWRYPTSTAAEKESTADWRYQSSSSYTNCGTRSYYSTSGSVSSPNYPSAYPDNAHCEWVIEPGTSVYLKVTDLQLESCCDHLQIYDQYGYLLRNDSTLNELYGGYFRVVFTSDGSKSSRGFQIHWNRDYPSSEGSYWTTDVYTERTSTQDWRYVPTSPRPPLKESTADWRYQSSSSYTNCGTRSYYSSSGSVSSPNYPSAYPDNAHCEWVIEPGTSVYLKVTDLQLESCCDHLQIYDQYGYLLRNDSSLNELYGGYFRVVFTSDGSKSSRGFQIHWNRDYPYWTTDVYTERTSTQDWRYVPTSPSYCGTRNYHSIYGTLSSPNYPMSYPDNANCDYVIDPGTYVYLTLTDFDLETCCDHLVIYDAGGRKTSLNLNDPMYSNRFRVVFTTDGSSVHRGFQLHWSRDVSHLGLSTERYNTDYTTQGYLGSTRATTRNTSPGWWGQTTNWWRQTTDSWMRQTSDRWGWATTAGSQWPYSTDSANGIRVNCNSRDLSVAVPRDVLRQVFPGASVYDLTLNNPNCKGQVYPDVVMFSSSILGCGMTREETRYEVVYQNRIRPSRRSPSTSSYNWYATSEAAITRFDSTDIKVECRLDNYATAVGFYRPKHNHELVARGHGNFSAYMDFYHDYNYNYKITSYPLSLALNEDVFVDLRLDTGDPTLKITAQTCYASSSSDPHTYYSNRYTLISNGCPADPTVALEYSPAQHVHFRFRSFEFLKDKDHVYIFCQVNVCNDTDYYNRCHQNCNTRHRRDAVETEDHDFKIFQGPLKFRNERSTDFHAGEKGKKDSTLSGSVPAIAMAVSAVAMVIAAVVMVITRTRRQNRSPANNEDRVI